MLQNLFSTFLSRLVCSHKKGISSEFHSDAVAGFFPAVTVTQARLVSLVQSSPDLLEAAQTNARKTLCLVALTARFGCVIIVVVWYGFSCSADSFLLLL